MSARETKLLRVGLLALVLAALAAAAHFSGVTESLDVARIRALIEAAGALGVVLFLAVFAVGELLHVPGIVFVVAGVLAYGKVLGFPLALAGALGSLSLSFAVVRGVGGSALAELERPWVRRLLGHLEHRPVRTVALLRLVLFLMPALNYGLALTRVRYRDYLLGSAIGILPQLVGVTFLADWVAATWLS